MKLVFRLLSGLALTTAMSISALASPVLVIAGDGTLMGANGVEVNGTLYDVTFGDGYISDSISAFTNSADALAASQALLDQVTLGVYDIADPSVSLLDNGYLVDYLGPFHNVNGCTDRRCYMITGYSSYLAGEIGYFVKVGTAFNYRPFPDEADADYTKLEDIPAGENTLGTGRFPGLAAFTIATWTATAVPEPEVYAMMLAGLGLVGFAARRKQK